MENGYPAKLPATYGQRTILLLSGSGLRLTDGVLGFSLGRTDPSQEPRIIRRCQNSPHQSQVISILYLALGEDHKTDQTDLNFRRRVARYQK